MAEGDNGLAILGLESWPFDVTPDMGGTLIWADRSELRRQIDRLLRKLTAQDSNSLHLLWADFGAGKTHTLLFIRQLCSEGPYTSVQPLYAALPKGTKSFVDVYRALARSFSPDQIRGAYEAAVVRLGRDELESQLKAIWPSFLSALRVLTLGNDAQQQGAMAWLLAEPTQRASDLASLSIPTKIRTVDEAVLALSALVKLLLLSGKRRVLLMVDEFQRIQELRAGLQNDINAGLHSFFNACPPGLSLLLCFSFGAERHIKAFLNDELLSRADPIRLTIPTLSGDEAVQFVNDLWAYSLMAGREPPIDTAAVRYIAERISKEAPITPRRLKKSVGLVVSEGMLDIQDGQIAQIDSAYCAHHLTDDIVKQIAGDASEGE